MMLESFYLIRKAVRKALIYVKLQPSIVFADEEFEHIHNVYKLGRWLNWESKSCVSVIQIF